MWRVFMLYKAAVLAVEGGGLDEKRRILLWYWKRGKQHVRPRVRQSVVRERERSAHIRSNINAIHLFTRKAAKNKKQKRKKKCLWVRVAERLLMTSLVASLSNYWAARHPRPIFTLTNIIKQTADISQAGLDGRYLADSLAARGS